jgi:putative component of membrane protein insertase Oxa1/YidC/SpoIIIJ protein YidD
MQGFPQSEETYQKHPPSQAITSSSDAFAPTQIKAPTTKPETTQTTHQKHWFSWHKDFLKPSENFLTHQVDELLSDKITETKLHPNRMVFFARIGKSLSAAGIHGYQFVTRQVPGFSSAYQHTFVCSHRMCMGKLSCSESTQMAIQTHGPLWGIAWGTMRIASCAPGIDEKHPIGQLLSEPLGVKPFGAKFQELRKTYPRWQQWLPGAGVTPERLEVLKRLKKLAWLDADLHYGSWPPKFVKQALAKVGFDWDEQMQPALRVFPEKQEAWIEQEVARIRNDIKKTDQRRATLVQNGLLHYSY